MTLNLPTREETRYLNFFFNYIMGSRLERLKDKNIVK